MKNWLRQNPISRGERFGWRVAFMAGVAGGLSWAVPASADVLRCGSQLASTGDTLYEVRSSCGEPDASARRVEYRMIQRRIPVACPRGSLQRYCEAVISESVEVTIDEWTYDFGRNRFIEHAVFEQGRLVRVETRGYGKKDPA